MTYDFDYFVIGGGSGGVRSARIAAQNNIKVGLAEEAKLGGTCVNVGCVPKKLMAYAADYGMALTHMNGFGWSASGTFDWEILKQNKDAEIKRLNKIYENVLTNAGVHFFPYKAVFIDEHTLQINNKQITADKILIATGGAPRLPTYAGHEFVYVSDDLFFLDKLPKHAVIQGGGYIGVEFAHILHGLGVNVTILNRSPIWLREFDHDLQQHLKESYIEMGINVCFECDITQVIQPDTKNLIVETTDGRHIHCDAVFSVIGRIPNTNGLNLDKINVACASNGQIKVNENWQTSQPHIYALGDVSNQLNLTPYAIAEGHILAERLFSNKPIRQADFNHVPTAVFSSPPIGTVGLSEEEAHKKGFDIKIFKTNFKPMSLALTNSPQRTLMKLVVDRETDKVLGVHMIGPDAPEIIQGFATALVAGATKTDFDRTIGIHPTSAEEFVTMREEAKN